MLAGIRLSVPSGVPEYEIRVLIDGIGNALIQTIGKPDG